MTAETSQDVLYEVRDGIAWLTLNRPDRHNAVDAAGRRALRGHFAGFAADDAARVLVVTAAGGRTFCAGADLTEMAAGAVPPSAFSDCLEPLAAAGKPSIAAVNGAALGGGFLLAQACDLCVASAAASFGITEARWGRGAPWALPLFDMIPRRIALELLLTGAPMPAARALALGLVNAVVPPSELGRAAAALAGSIRENAPLSVRGHKAMARLASPGLDDRVAQAWRLFEPVYASEDAAEGPRAFAEKRRPAWQGR